MNITLIAAISSGVLLVGSFAITFMLALNGRYESKVEHENYELNKAESEADKLKLNRRFFRGSANGDRYSFRMDLYDIFTGLLNAEMRFLPPFLLFISLYAFPITILTIVYQNQPDDGASKTVILGVIYLLIPYSILNQLYKSYKRNRD